MSKENKSGVVESIARDSVVVSVAGKAHTLKGKAVEAVVSNLKLGDVVSFDDDHIPTTIGKTKKTAAPAAPRQATSPAAKPITTKEAW